MELRRPLDLGLVDDFDLLEALWRHGLSELGADPREHPMLLAEPAFVPAQMRERTAEIMFESLGVPALYLAKTPVLQAFSAGRGSALVLDVGAQGTRVTPVVDGFVLNRASTLSEIGGQALTEALADQMIKSGQLPDNFIWPRALLRRTLRGAAGGMGGAAGAGAGAGGAAMDEEGGGGGARRASVPAPASASASSTTASGAPRYLWDSARRTDVEYTSSFRTLMMLEAADDAKKALCSVAEVGFVESDAHPEKAYELPDGTVVRLSRARQLVPELLFRPETVEQFRSVVARHQVTTAFHLLSHAAPHSPLQRLLPPIRNDAGETVSLTAQPFPLQVALRWSLSACAPEVRRDLCGHVLLTGGGSCLPGLAQRMKWETIAAVPPAFKPRLLTPSPVERQFGSWIGGSIMSSLGTFVPMWMTKAEFEEHGAHYIDSKCH